MRYVFVCVSVCPCVHAYSYVCVCVCTHIHMYACMCVCVHVHVHPHWWYTNEPLSLSQLHKPSLHITLSNTNLLTRPHATSNTPAGIAMHHCLPKTMVSLTVHCIS